MLQPVLSGMWGSPQQFNVAITRARALLVVVGHPVVLMEVLLLLFAFSSMAWQNMWLIPACTCSACAHRSCAACEWLWPQVDNELSAMQDAHWRELLRHCAARGAYLGAGASQIADLVRQDAPVTAAGLVSAVTQADNQARAALLDRSETLLAGNAAAADPCPAAT